MGASRFGRFGHRLGTALPSFARGRPDNPRHTDHQTEKTTQVGPQRSTAAPRMLGDTYTPREGRGECQPVVFRARLFETSSKRFPHSMFGLHIFRARRI